MLGSLRLGVVAGATALIGISRQSYVMARAAAPPEGGVVGVEFTPDGKLKRPVGYRKWVYVARNILTNDLNNVAPTPLDWPAAEPLPSA